MATICLVACSAISLENTDQSMPLSKPIPHKYMLNIKPQKINSQKKLLNNDMMVNSQEKNINDINLTEEQKIVDMYYISKTILKLTVKQSKNLQEGKEYIINSLGLLINNENKTKDGLTIFGDVNVIKYFY